MSIEKISKEPSDFVIEVCGLTNLRSSFLRQRINILADSIPRIGGIGINPLLVFKLN